jgi:hypothetical protein
MWVWEWCVRRFAFIFSLNLPGKREAGVLAFFGGGGVVGKMKRVDAMIDTADLQPLQSVR